MRQGDGIRRTMGAHVSGFRQGRHPGPGEGDSESERKSLPCKHTRRHLPTWEQTQTQTEAVSSRRHAVRPPSRPRHRSWGSKTERRICLCPPRWQVLGLGVAQVAGGRSSSPRLETQGRGTFRPDRIPAAADQHLPRPAGAWKQTSRPPLPRPRFPGAWLARWVAELGAQAGRLAGWHLVSQPGTAYPPLPITSGLWHGPPMHGVVAPWAVLQVWRESDDALPSPGPSPRRTRAHQGHRAPRTAHNMHACVQHQQHWPARPLARVSVSPLCLALPAPLCLASPVIIHRAGAS